MKRFKVYARQSVVTSIIVEDEDSIEAMMKAEDLGVENEGWELEYDEEYPSVTSTEEIEND